MPSNILEHRNRRDACIIKNQTLCGSNAFDIAAANKIVLDTSSPHIAQNIFNGTPAK